MGINFLPIEPKIFMEGEDVKDKGYFFLDLDLPFNGAVGLWKAG
jgi:hypothetical protein